jgi:agmatinase
MAFDPSAAAAPDSGIYGLDSTVDDARVVLIPVPFEATVSYGGGAGEGPKAILEASRQVDLFDLETGRPYAAGICLIDEDPAVRAWAAEAKELAAPVIEKGGAGSDPALRAVCAKVDALGDKVNDWLEKHVARLIEQGKLVGVVGGDHSVPFAAIAAHAKRYPGLGVLHVDAHADLRDAYEGFRWSHASIMKNVLDRVPELGKLVGVGYRDLSEEEHKVITTDARVEAFHDPWLQRRLQDGTAWGAIALEIVDTLPQDVYVSFDIDGLDPVLCPNTGTPVPGGLSFAQATALFRVIVESGRRIVGFDLVEVAPDPTGESEWDGNVAARLLYKLIGFALKSQK